MPVQPSLGFIGLGVMGEAMCRNLARKSGARLLGYDLRPKPLDRLAADGVQACESIAGLCAEAEVIFLSLPGGDELEAVCLGPGGLVEHGRAGQTVVDHGTSPVALTRRIAEAFGAKGMGFADAPVARTRAAAEAGTLSIMIGGEAAAYRRILPYLQCMASDITHCGPIGAGQVVKLMNNMVLVQTVVALAEALATGRRAGVDGQILFDALSKGSADSFALRNHGMKSLLPGDFPDQAFSTEYALKDLSYALALARDAGIAAEGAETARRVLEETIAQGFGAAYFPALLQAIGNSGADA